MLLEHAVKSAVFYQAMDRNISCFCSTKAPETRVVCINNLISTFKIFFSILLILIGFSININISNLVSLNVQKYSLK